MATKVVVLLLDADSTKPQRDAITEWLRGTTGVGFWHHIEHSWIIAVPEHVDLTKTAIRDKARDIAPGINTMVLDVKRGTWAGLAPKEAHQWLTDNLSSP